MAVKSRVNEKKQLMKKIMENFRPDTSTGKMMMILSSQADTKMTRVYSAIQLMNLQP